MTMFHFVIFLEIHVFQITVEPRYNEVLGTMKITLLYQVSCYIRVKKLRNIKSWDQQNYLVIRGFRYSRPLYNEVPLYLFFFSTMLLSIILKFIVCFILEVPVFIANLCLCLNYALSISLLQLNFLSFLKVYINASVCLSVMVVARSLQIFMPRFSRFHEMQKLMKVYVLCLDFIIICVVCFEMFFTWDWLSQLYIVPFTHK